LTASYVCTCVGVCVYVFVCVCVCVCLRVGVRVLVIAKLFCSPSCQCFALHGHTHVISPHASFGTIHKPEREFYLLLCCLLCSRGMCSSTIPRCSFPHQCHPYFLRSFRVSRVKKMFTKNPSMEMMQIRAPMSSSNHKNNCVSTLFQSYLSLFVLPHLHPPLHDKYCVLCILFSHNYFSFLFVFLPVFWTDNELAPRGIVGVSLLVVCFLYPSALSHPRPRDLPRGQPLRSLTTPRPPHDRRRLPSRLFLTVCRPMSRTRLGVLVRSYSFASRSRVSITFSSECTFYCDLICVFEYN